MLAVAAVVSEVRVDPQPGMRVFVPVHCAATPGVSCACETARQAPAGAGRYGLVPSLTAGRFPARVEGTSAIVVLSSRLPSQSVRRVVRASYHPITGTRVSHPPP